MIVLLDPPSDVVMDINPISSDVSADDNGTSDPTQAAYDSANYNASFQNLSYTIMSLGGEANGWIPSTITLP